MFFESLKWFAVLAMEHWLLAIVGALYLVWAYRVASGFLEEVLLNTAVFCRALRSTRFKKWPWLRVITRLAGLLPCLLVCTAIAPVLWLPLRQRRRREEERLEQEQREYCRQQEDRRQREEDSRRQQDYELAAARKEWLLGHPATLYLNAVNGITAVMTVEEYERIQEATRVARINETWIREDLLLPGKVYLFVTDPARARLVERASWQSSSWMMFASWLSDLYALAEEFNLRLEQRSDIFVPYISEALLSFKEQHELVGEAKEARWQLVERCAPPEIWPVSESRRAA